MGSKPTPDSLEPKMTAETGKLEAISGHVQTLADRLEQNASSHTNGEPSIQVRSLTPFPLVGCWTGAGGKNQNRYAEKQTFWLICSHCFVSSSLIAEEA